MKTLRDYINILENLEQPVEEGWKDKVAGAALAGAVALGGHGAAQAAPFSQGKNVDQMSGQEMPYINVKSEDKSAQIQIQKEGNETFIYFTTTVGKPDWTRGDGKIKFGGGPVQELEFFQNGSSNSIMRFRPEMAKKIAAHKGEMKIQIPIWGKEPKVFTFMIEPETAPKTFK